MKTNLATPVLLCLALFCPRYDTCRCFADEADQIVPGANALVNTSGTDFVMRGKTIARLEKGAKLEVVKVQGKWVAGFVVLEGKKRAGWVLLSAVTASQPVPTAKPGAIPAATSTYPPFDPNVKIPLPPKDEMPKMIVDVCGYLERTPHYNVASPTEKLKLLDALIRDRRVERQQIASLHLLLTTQYLEHFAGQDPQERLEAWRELVESLGYSKTRWNYAYNHVNNWTLLEILRHRPKTSGKETLEFLGELSAKYVDNWIFRAYQDFLLARCLVEETGDRSLDTRGTAQLELTADLGERNLILWNAGWSDAQRRGLARHTGFDPLFQELSLEKKIAHLHKLAKGKRVHEALGASASTPYVSQLLAADRSFMESDEAARKARLDTLRRGVTLITFFNRSAIERAFQLKVPDVYGYLAENAAYREGSPLERLKLLNKLSEDETIAFVTLSHRIRELILAHVEDRGGDDLDRRIAVWKELVELAQPDQPLAELKSRNMLRIEDLICDDHTRLVMASDAYRRGDDRALLQLLNELERERLQPGGTRLYHDFVFARLLHKETGSLVAAERSMAQLKFIAKAKKERLWVLGMTFIVQHPALALHLVYDQAFWQASPAEKMARLAHLHSEGLIEERTRHTFELPYAVQMLSADQQFMAKSSEEKQAYIEKLKTDKVISYSSQRELIKTFTAE